MEILPIARPARASADWFTGEVWSNNVTNPDDPARLRAYNVRFAPGARTTWHRHTVGQTLLVNDGTGLVQVRGGDLIRIRAGDAIYIEPGEWHWHGAAPDNFMVHLALQEGTSKDEGGSENGPFVTDEEYTATPACNA